MVDISESASRLLKDDSIVVALNLMGLSLIGRRVLLTQNVVFWPDGIMALVCGLRNKIKLNKIPGNQLILSIIDECNKHRGLELVILGTSNDYEEINTLFKGPVRTYKLPFFSSLNEIEQFNPPALYPNSVVFIGMASPKQEILAQKIFERQKVKIFCFGGAINMTEKRETICPPFFQNLGLEWLYRLKSDPFRRVKRLLLTLPSGLLTCTSLFLKKLD